MKNWFSILTIGTLSLLAVTSCEKDETKVIIQPGAAPKLTASGNSMVLLKENANSKAVTYTWTPTSFGYQAAVNYTLQFDKKGGNFSKPVSFNAGNSLTKTLTVSELNGIYVGFDLASTTPTPAALDVRVVASVGPASASVASPVSALVATPYDACDQPEKPWSLIGPAGMGWDKDVVMTYDCKTKAYTYTGLLNADSFKFRYNRDWTANLGGASAAGGALTQDGPDMKISAARTYTIVLMPGEIDSKGKVGGGSFTIK